MSHRKSFGAAYHGGGGRLSPYQSSAYLASQSDRSLSDLYSYVEGDNYTHSHDAAVFEEDEKSPDMIYVRYQNDSWPFTFPPFSIAEEQVLVKHIRERVAEKLNVSDRRVRLIYKERVLRRNHNSLRDYGCKQNSEISARITLEPRDYDNYRGDSDSDSGSAISRNRGSDEDHHHSRRHRHLSHSRPHHDEPRSAHPLSNASNGMLHPHHPSPPVRETREPRDYQPRPTQLSNSRPDSPNYASSGGRHSPKSNGPSPRTSAQSVNVSTPTADPNTPLGKVQGMRHELHTKWIPEVESFLKAPPADADEKTKEYRRLSEILYKRVWEVGDMVDPSADEKNKEEIRALRKQSYAEAQALVNQLDVHKG